jgi:hypothetical protein
MLGFASAINIFQSSRFTFFLALNAQFFILSHQPDCARRKLDQLSHHLTTLDVCLDRQEDLFLDFIYSWYDYAKLEYDYHTHAYDRIRNLCERTFYSEYQQHKLALDWHRLLYHRLHILYRLTCFQQLRKNEKLSENKKRFIWK